MSVKSIYEIRIKNQGVVETTLIQEGVAQAQACTQILNLSRSLGDIEDHDELCSDPQPVNVGLNIPGLTN